MKNYKLLITLVGLTASSFAATPTAKAPQIESHEIAKFAEVLQYVDKNQTKQHPDQLCLIYDMDNTILSAEPNVGSDSWMAWNSKLSLDNPNRISNWQISNDLHGFEGALRFFIKYYPTENSTLATLNQIKDQQGHPSIVMTARSYERYYAATNNQLLVNQMDFTTNPIGKTGAANQALTLTPNDATTGYKAYFKGVFYSADDNKGTEILKLIADQRKLNKNPTLCETTIFVDNSATNTKNVYHAFLGNSQKLNLVALHYTHYDNYLTTNPQDLKTWNINESASQGQNLLNLIKQLNAK